MALPMLKKVWQFSVNNYQAASGNVVTDHRNLMFKVKSLMIGTGTHPWTVVRSCDSVSVADADLWLAAGNLIWTNAGAAHSWIVLRQTGILANFQVCLDLETFNLGGGVWDPPFERGMVMVISPAAGFTGGTALARPTATDEAVFKSGDPHAAPLGYTGWWFGNHWLTFSSVAHYMISNDGACTRIVMYSGGIPCTLWLFDTLAEASLSNTCPIAVSVISYDSTVHGYVDYDLNNWARCCGTVPGVLPRFQSYFTCEGLANACIGEHLIVANDLSGEWTLTGVGVACEEAGVRGRLGGLYDLWWGSTGVGEGDTYPDDSTYQFAQFGDLVFPWDGLSVPVVNTPPGVDTQRKGYLALPALPPAPRIVPIEDD